MSAKNHFVIGYAGNKREEVKYVKDDILSDIKDKNIMTIIEPFCGTSAISYEIWKNSANNITFILNDNNEYLMKLYQIIKDNKIDEFLEDMEKLNKTLDTKIKYDTHKKNENIDPFIRWYICNKYYRIIKGLWNSKPAKKSAKPSLEKKEFYKFIQSDNVKLMSKDWKILFNEFKDDKQALFIMDPPYIGTNNDFYFNGDGMDIYKYFYENPIHNFNCCIKMVLENIFLIDVLFKQYRNIKYSKKYTGNNPRKSEHIIITNEIKQ